MLVLKVHILISTLCIYWLFNLLWSVWILEKEPADQHNTMSPKADPQAQSLLLGEQQWQHREREKALQQTELESWHLRTGNHLETDLGLSQECNQNGAQAKCEPQNLIIP